LSCRGRSPILIRRRSPLRTPLTGLPQPKLSNLLRGKFTGVSEDRLMRCLAALGQDVTITVAPAKKERGRVEVALAA
jgi:hypothetical protein